MKKWQLIVFEGIDGAGKATQVELLAKALRREGRTVTVFSFPNYKSRYGKFIKESLHGKHGDYAALDGYDSSIPYALDRALARAKIVAAQKRGIVICDRYTTSTLAFGAARMPSAKRAAFREFFEDLEYQVLKLPQPDTVVYLSMPITLTRVRLRDRGRKLDSNERDLRYQKAVAAEYAKLAKRKKWRTIPCRVNESPEAIQKRVRDVLR